MVGGYISLLVESLLIPLFKWLLKSSYWCNNVFFIHSIHSKVVVCIQYIWIEGCIRYTEDGIMCKYGI